MIIIICLGRQQQLACLDVGLVDLNNQLNLDIGLFHPIYGNGSLRQRL
jgi:hypothetical protein